ncbi:MmcQ/YjbR family DNA-binding protein [Asticcacaulis sp. EMRT-3]|uniref:MmcQ/YjbR family DNA-binding protein n=1 Tax=Asticcacaulis sp. EMRT-3 TaxID=3040349 RepID=UPI0024AE96E9|nr:MmcQ/YjbR family DNA-binding protein [Asticcacaulis sp. EMRT-3]MDI7774990.1 MmcQ/YjbR family DNA-binding protein [Asticcacaulis sp. EMRT-3]
MTSEQANAFCAALPASLHVVQWGGADVWKVGNADRAKVYAICRMEGDHFTASFKVSDMGFEVLRDHPDCRPAPYLASRGMKWIQYYRGDEMRGDDLLGLLAASHDIVAAGLPKKTRAALGLPI